MKKICKADFLNGAASPGEQEVYHTPVCLKGTSASVMLPVAAATHLKKEVNSSKASTLRQLELKKKVQELDDL